VVKQCAAWHESGLGIGDDAHRMHVIKPRLSGWNFADRERELATTAKEIPTWRLANQARRTLAAVTAELSQEIPSPVPEDPARVPAEMAIQLACLSLAALIVRTAGSVIVLIGAGYEREALSPARSVLEAVLRGRQATDDPSGDAARGVLTGRPSGSLKSLAHRYGDKADIEFLDRFAHADPLTLLALSTPLERTTNERALELRPCRGLVGPGNQLFAVAHQAMSFTGVLAEAFGVAVQFPPWVDGQLRHYRDHPLPTNL
jgi:hypothetical protein